MSPDFSTRLSADPADDRMALDPLCWLLGRLCPVVCVSTTMLLSGAKVQTVSVFHLLCQIELKQSEVQAKIHLLLVSVESIEVSWFHFNSFFTKSFYPNRSILGRDFI